MSIRTEVACWCTALLAVFSSPAVSAVSDSITITVNPGERQSFGGLGFNLSDLTPIGWSTNAATQQTFIRNMITTSRFRNIVLWGYLWMNPYDSTSSDTTHMTIKPLALNIATWAQQAGVDFIMINPISNRPQNDHVKFWTQCVQMWRRHGVNVNAMTFLNKANTGQNGVDDSGKKRREPAAIAAGIKQLRRTLDSLGLTDVRLCSPSTVEWHPRQWSQLIYGDRYDYSDGDTAAYVNALTADPDAMAAIDAFDMQSYGTGVGNWLADIASTRNKEIWVSLSATDAPYEWDASDPRGKNALVNGPIIAGTCLSDLNHGVSRWNFWLLYNLIRNAASATAPQYFIRYHYMAAISQRFDQGAVFRQCTSNHSRLPSPDMRWNYNRTSPTQVLQTQPDVIAAAARNPDSSWAVGIVNISSLLTQHKASNDSGTARTYRVKVSIPELQGLDSLQFTAGKCDDATGVKAGGTFVMRNGALTLDMNARELYVLRSTKARTRASSRIAARETLRYRIGETAVHAVFSVEVPEVRPSLVAMRVLSAGGRTILPTRLLAGGRCVIDLRNAAPGLYFADFRHGPHVVRGRIIVR